METNRINTAVPLMATHPTEMIRDEIRARGMSQKELADRMGMKPSNVSRMFKEKETITSTLAAKLEIALGIRASFWINAQANYDKDVIAVELRDERECASRETEFMLSSLLNMKELYAKLKIRSSLFVQEKMEALRQIFGIEPVCIPSCRIAYEGDFKKSDVAETNEKNQRTWQVLAYLSAKCNKPHGKYVEGNARKAALEIASVAHSGNISEMQIKETLDKYGISYSVVSKLEKTPIDAYSTWMDDYPAIVTTHRYDDVCKLVFNVIHELGHIELHLRTDTSIAFVSSGEYSADQKEEEANKFAESIIIPYETWKDIMNTSPKGIAANNIVQNLREQAKSKGLNFGLVMWRYKYETHKYALRGVKSEKINHPLQEHFA